MHFLKTLKNLKISDCELTKLLVLPLIIWLMYFYLKFIDLIFEACYNLGAIFAG